jgi:hypothetical protein
MNKKTGLWALSLFAISGSVVISCGGSSDGDDMPGSTAGSSSSSGSSSGGSGGTTAGTSSTAGTTSTSGAGNTAGTATTGGTATGGAAAGGTGPFPVGGDGPTFPGAGGDGNNAACPATQPTDGETCTLMSGMIDCDYADVTCNCRRVNGGMTRAWDCGGDNPGAGGAGPGFGDAMCPADAQDGADCTGVGQCAGQQCFCFNDQVNCF